jgi:diguanylate cyclase
MTGLLFGTTLLASGFALGFWIARRTGPTSSSAAPGSLPAEVDSREFLSVVRSIAEATNLIASDISHYQCQMHSLVDLSRELPEKDAAELKPILDQILLANTQMQERLEAAERMLEQQHGQLESYLTEARTDALTSLPNRRAFDQALDELYAQHLATNQPVTLVLLDVDHFKKINDTYGHAVGDVVLKRVASHLAACAKDCQLVARYGGEEFGLLFAEPRQSAARVTESLRAALADDTIEAEGHRIQVTMSAGVAQLQAGERLGDLVRHSDQALYQAKEQGRNRVVCYQSAASAANEAERALPPKPQHTNHDSQVDLMNGAAGEGHSPQNLLEIESRLRNHLNQMVHVESMR